MTQKLDLAVVGAGIAGLAHAYHAAKRGLSVAVFERGSRAQGASIRNFGLIWPIGQPAGPLQERASRSRAHWRTLTEAAGLAVEPSGSLHLAYRDDEWAVLEEFTAEHLGDGHDCRLITPAEAIDLSPAVNPDGLLGALHSGSECTATSPAVIAALAAYLECALEVEFHWRHAVTAVETGRLIAGGKTVEAEQIMVCSGTDMETLFPQRLQNADLVRCKLQMLAAEPPSADFALGPALCAGLTLLHYEAFAGCRSLAALRARIEAELPDTREHGVHILVSQHAGGELIIGDSHHYGEDPGPFDSEAVNQIILRELAKFTRFGELRISRRWHGVYLKARGATEWIDQPCEGVTLVNGLGGTGMTLSLGLAEEQIAALFGEAGHA